MGFKLIIIKNKKLKYKSKWLANERKQKESLVADLEVQVDKNKHV